MAARWFCVETAPDKVEGGFPTSCFPLGINLICLLYDKRTFLLVETGG